MILFRNTYISNKDIQNSISTIITEYKSKIMIYKELEKSAVHILQEIFDDSNIKIEDIKSRTKSEKSLIDKIIRKTKEKNELYKTIDDITDIVGIRIVVFFAEDIPEIIEILKKEFVIDNYHSNTRLYDFDRFGYLSEHEIVEIKNDKLQQIEYKNIKFEIQIRTVLQDVWAEINHSLEYKSKTILSYEKKRMLTRLAATLEWIDDTFTSFKDSNIYTLSHADLFFFILKNELVQQLDQIAIETPSYHANIEFDHILKIFKILYFHSIDSILLELKENARNIEIFIEQMLMYGIRFKFHEGISMAYFAMFLAVKNLEKNDFIKKFLSANIFKQNHYNEVEILYDKSKKCYNRSQLIIKLNLEGRL